MELTRTSDRGTGLFDLDRVREETPGCLNNVFLDSAGSSLPPAVVLDTQIAHLRREAEVGGYLAAEERSEDLDAVRSSIARMVNGTAGGVALMDSATRAWTQFFYGVPLSRGDRVLIAQAEYASNAIAALQRARREGVSVEVIPSAPDGRLDVEALEASVDDRVRVLSLVHVPTNGGLVNPVAEATRIARACGSLVLLDACQSAGQIQLDVQKLGVDALAATGRKWLRGPRGTGFLYVRPELMERIEPPVLDLHSAVWTAPDEFTVRADARRFELWESSPAALLGLGAAVDYYLRIGPAEVEQEVRARATHLRHLLAAIPGVTVQDLGPEPCGIVSFTVHGVPAATVREELARRGVTVTVSHAPSTLLDMTARGLSELVRASPHYFVTDGQLDHAARSVAALAAAQ